MNTDRRISMGWPRGPIKSASRTVCFGIPTMTPDNLKRMSIDQLWALHAEIAAVLAHRISAEKRRLELRLKQLHPEGTTKGNHNPGHQRRPYPRVFPKYRNPANPSETWAGRGKQPRWLTAQLRAGGKLDDFRIHRSSDDRKRRSASR
jgi:DNA-binding protein H-NS